MALKMSSSLADSSNVLSSAACDTMAAPNKSVSMNAIRG